MISADGGGCLAIWEGLKTDRDFNLGQLLHMLKGTCATSSGEASAPGFPTPLRRATTVRYSARQMRECVPPADIHSPQVRVATPSWSLKRISPKRSRVLTQNSIAVSSVKPGLAVSHDDASAPEQLRRRVRSATA